MKSTPSFVIFRYASSLALFLLVAALGNTSSGGVMATASSMTQLTFSGVSSESGPLSSKPDDLFVGVEILDPFLGTFSDGDATSTAETSPDAGLSELGLGETLSLASSAMASASAPPNSVADGFAGSTAFVDIFNDSLTATYVVTFDAVVSVSAAVSFDDPALQDGFADAFALLGPDEGPDLEFFAFSSVFDGGIPDSTVDDTISFSFTLAPGEFASLIAFNDTAAFALAVTPNNGVVPEPASLGVWGLLVGCLAIGGIRTRRLARSA